MRGMWQISVPMLYGSGKGRGGIDGERGERTDLEFGAREADAEAGKTYARNAISRVHDIRIAVLTKTARSDLVR